MNNRTPVMLTAVEGAAVASSASSVPIMAANASRIRGSILNDSTALLTIRYSAQAADATHKGAIIAAGATFNIPDGYTGAITGFWASVNGAAYPTEFE